MWDEIVPRIWPMGDGYILSCTQSGVPVPFPVGLKFLRPTPGATPGIVPGNPLTGWPTNKSKPKSELHCQCFFCHHEVKMLFQRFIAPAVRLIGNAGKFRGLATAATDSRNREMVLTEKLGAKNNAMLDWPPLIASTTGMLSCWILAMWSVSSKIILVLEH